MQRDVDALRVRVLGDVRQRFLRDAEDQRREIAVDIGKRLVDIEVDGDAMIVVE